MEIKENYFEKNGIKIKYFEMGEGESLIFLHGGGIRALTYLNCLKLLSNKYKVYAPDLPNFGESSIPSRIWGFSDYAEFLNEFINYLPINDVTIVGHSFGGGIALHLANKNTKIKRIILANPAGMIKINSLPKAYCNFFIKKTINDLFINPAILFIALQDFLFNVTHKFLHLPTIFKIVIKTLKEEPINLEIIKIPILILWGKDDEVFPSRDKSRLVPTNSVQIKFVEGNHDWILFHPEYLMKFL
jgi:pimeloyl-ACP methyl ester carboxylesterase